MDSHPYSYENSIFTLGAPHEEVQGRQTKLHPDFNNNINKFFYSAHTVLCALYTQLKVGVRKKMLLQGA